MPELAIVTLTRNPVYLKRLSEALDAQVGAPSLEKELVDNADSPVVRMVAQEHGWGGVTPGYNTSFSEGCNLGAAMTTAPRVLFLNDDAVPHANFLAAMWDQRGKADVLGALLLNHDGTVNHAGTAVWASDCRTDHLGRGRGREEFDQPKFAVTPSVTFAAAMVRRDVWLELGGLDEGYQYGWEDTDFCLRAISAGYVVGVARRAVAEHDECGTRPRGGAADQQNYNRFNRLWSASLGPLLSAYADREPKVEGVYA